MAKLSWQEGGPCGHKLRLATDVLACFARDASTRWGSVAELARDALTLCFLIEAGTGVPALVSAEALKERAWERGDVSVAAAADAVTCMLAASQPK